MLENYIPSFFVNVEKILFMIGYENRRVASLYFFCDSRVFGDYPLKFWIILFGDSNTFCQIDGDVEYIILESKKSCLWDGGVFQKILVYVFGIYEPLEVDLEHDSHIADEQVFHIVVLWTLMFLPNKVSNEPFYNEPVRTDLV